MVLAYYEASNQLVLGYLTQYDDEESIFFSSYHGHGVAPSPKCIMHSHPSTTASAMLRETEHPFVMNSTICFQLFFHFRKA
jgi:hypothetical protein